MSSVPLFFQCLRNKYISRKISLYQRVARGQCMKVTLPFVCKQTKDLVELGGYGVCVSLSVSRYDYKTYAQEFMMLSEKEKSMIKEIVFLPSEVVYTIDDGFIPMNVKSIAMGSSFNQPITMLLFPSSVEKINLSNAYYFQHIIDIGQLPESLKELSLPRLAQEPFVNGPFSPSLKKLKIQGFLAPHSGNTLPEGLETLELGLHQNLLSYLPHTIKTLITSDIRTLANIPSSLTDVQVSKNFNPDTRLPPTVKKLKYTHDFGFLYRFPTIPIHLRELECLVLEHYIDIDAGCLPKSLEKLTYFGFFGKIRPGAIGPNVSDLTLVFSNQMTSFDGIHIPQDTGIKKMYLVVGKLSKLPKSQIIPQSVTNLKLLSADKQFVKDNIPKHCITLDLLNSPLSSSLVLPNTVTSFTYQSNDGTVLKPTHLPKSLTNLQLHTESKDCFLVNQKFNKTFLSSLTSLIELSLPRVMMEVGLIPNTVRKLAFTLGPGGITKTSNLIPNLIPESVRELDLYADYSFKVSLKSLLPETLVKLVCHNANFSYEIGDLPSKLEYIDFGTDQTSVVNYNFLPNSLIVIKNLPPIKQENHNVSLPTSLTSLQMSQSTYQTSFLDTNTLVPNHITFLNITIN